jgi:two-component system response regulator FixJ
VTRLHLIDDDDALRLSLAALIGAWPEWRVATWRSGSDFLRAASTAGPGVVLVDQDMPGATGLDVLRSTASDPRFAVVLMSEAADIRLAIDSFRAGVVQLIEKPCDPGALRDALTEAAHRVERRRPVLEARARIARLSRREREVLDELVSGSPNKVIAHTLAISPRTVEVYRASLMGKLGVASLSAAVRLTFAAGLTPEAELEPVALAA